MAMMEEFGLVLNRRGSMIWQQEAFPQGIERRRGSMLMVLWCEFFLCPKQVKKS